MASAVDWNTLITGAGMTLAAHPFSYVKVLIQLGYEPLPPVIKKDMFFRKRFMYPGVFEYMATIKDRDGGLGLYRGVVPRICANATMSLTYGIMKKNLVKDEDELRANDEEPDFQAVCISVTKESICRGVAVILSHPFHVIAMRTMGSHIGSDPMFSTVYGAASTTYMDEGIKGFFAGLVPRLIHELATLWIAELLAYVINKFVITEKVRHGLGLEEVGELRDARNYVPIATNYVSQGLCYPLAVTTTVMTCNGANLVAGRPPFVSVYDSWYDCVRDLRAKGVDQRGSSMMFRAAVLSHTLDASSDSCIGSPYIHEIDDPCDSCDIDDCRDDCKDD